MKIQTLKEINGKWLPIIKEITDIENTEQIIDNRSTQEKIVDAIREKYSIDDEIALLRQRDIKKDEFKEYFDFVEKCKQNVKSN